jgi:flagellar protein FliO/FliZ
MPNLSSQWLMAGIALAAVLALIWALSRGARAFGLAPAVGKRLQAAEMLPLDGKRRLVLVRCDGREVLLLLGGPQDTVVGWLP